MRTTQWYIYIFYTAHAYAAACVLVYNVQNSRRSRSSVGWQSRRRFQLLIKTGLCVSVEEKKNS
jgi:hypothetical protein